MGWCGDIVIVIDNPSGLGDFVGILALPAEIFDGRWVTVCTFSMILVVMNLDIAMPRCIDILEKPSNEVKRFRFGISAQVE
jgi:hypothetical protein